MSVARGAAFRGRTHHDCEREDAFGADGAREAVLGPAHGEDGNAGLPAGLLQGIQHPAQTGVRVGARPVSKCARMQGGARVRRALVLVRDDAAQRLCAASQCTHDGIEPDDRAQLRICILLKRRSALRG